MASTTLTARILTTAARELDKHATMTHPIGGHEIPACMTSSHRDIAISRAITAVLQATPGYMRLAEQQAIANAARAALPPIAGTVTQYANRLRAANSERTAA